MGRQLRNLDPDNTHHVYSRCIDNQFLLRKGKVKKIFCNILKKSQKKFKYELNFFMIMDNHFHFAITTRPEGATLDRIMQYIKSKFARTYNKMYNRTGPFWNERYKDKIIACARKAGQYFNILMVYLGFNPVKANIVKHPGQYKYSSYNDYMGGRNPLGIDIKIHPLFDAELVKSIVEMRFAYYGTTD